MLTKQLSVFVENKEGAMLGISEALAEFQIDIRAISIADTTDFGILRLIVKDTEKAIAALKSKNIIVSVNDIIVVAMPDKPGSLSKVLAVLAEGKVNIEYMYAFLTVSNDKAFVAIKVENNEKTVELLSKNGIETIDNSDINF